MLHRLRSLIHLHCDVMTVTSLHQCSPESMIFFEVYRNYFTKKYAIVYIQISFSSQYTPKYLRILSILKNHHFAITRERSSWTWCLRLFWLSRIGLKKRRKNKIIKGKGNIRGQQESILLTSIYFNPGMDSNHMLRKSRQIVCNFNSNMLCSVINSILTDTYHYAKSRFIELGRKWNSNNATTQGVTLNISCLQLYLQAWSCCRLNLINHYIRLNTSKFHVINWMG